MGGYGILRNLRLYRPPAWPSRALLCEILQEFMRNMTRPGYDLAPMYVNATDLSIRWLCEPAADPIQVAVAQRELPRAAAPFPEGQGQGWMEILDLPLGMHVCRVVHRFAPGLTGLAPMSAVRTELHEPMLFIQTTRVGSGVLVDRRLHQRLAHDAATGIFQHLDGVDHQHWAETRASLEVTALGMSYSRLQAILGVATARDLLAALGIAALPSARVQPLSRPVKALLESCLADHVTGPLRQLHAQARVLDFLVALVGQGPDRERSAASQRQALQGLREELDQLPGQVPDLDELARRYGYSARALNAGFKREFGQTLYAYVTNQRLAAAHACLLGGQASIKAVAARLGYANVSHFSQAFTRKFGYRPGRVGKASPPDHDDERLLTPPA